MPGSTTRPAPSQVTLSTEGKQTVLDAGGGDDKIDVAQRRDGGLSVTTNGETFQLTATESKNLTIRGGTGADTITLDTGVTIGVTIEGGDGKDIIFGGAGADIISGGRDSDYIEGRGGNDRLNGDEGRDTLYGLDGNDTIRGGAGNDYIDGGKGNDYLYGQDGNDAVSGGLGDDFITGNRGNDTLIAGAGKDIISDIVDKSDTDKIFAEASDTLRVNSSAEINEVDMSATNAAGGELGSSISVSGSAEFDARVQSDLETLRSMTDGQTVLASLDDSGNKTTFEATTGGNAASGFTTASDATVKYNISNIAQIGPGERPPIVGMFHELLHAQDFVNGTLATGDTVEPGETAPTPNSELSTTGLPYDQDGDGVADPNTRAITDNSFREDLQVEKRTNY